MTVPFKKFTRIVYLISFIVWSALAVVYFFNDSKLKTILMPIYILLAILWGFQYWYTRKGYLKIENGILWVNGYTKWKKIDLNSLINHKKYAGDYMFTTKEGVVTVAATALDEPDLKKLNEELAKYDITFD